MELEQNIELQLALENSEKIREKVGVLWRDRGREGFELTNNFAFKLKRKYGEVEVDQYLLYHALIFSDRGTPKPKYDFEGEDSIAKFILEDGYKNIAK